MRHNFFKIVRTDKATTDDYDKSNKWARNKIDVLADKDVKHAVEELDCFDFYDDETIDMYIDSSVESSRINEWLENDNAGVYFVDGEYEPMIKIGDKI